MAIRKGKKGKTDGGAKGLPTEEPAFKVKNEGTADGQIESHPSSPMPKNLKIAKKGKSAK